MNRFDYCKSDLCTPYGSYLSEPVETKLLFLKCLVVGGLLDRPEQPQKNKLAVRVMDFEEVLTSLA
jgi:hypothetical protein